MTCSSPNRRDIRNVVTDIRTRAFCHDSPFLTSGDGNPQPGRGDTNGSPGKNLERRVSDQFTQVTLQLCHRPAEPDVLNDSFDDDGLAAL
jgi:hypothetical protein